jgi:hypothetical protein
MTTTALLVLTAGTAPAQAQALSSTPVQQLSFTGEAPAGCMMLTPQSPSSANASMTSSAPGSADIVIAQLVGEDGVSVGATVILTLPAACNQAHVLRLDSVNGGLINVEGTLASGPFRTVLPYAVAISWGSGSETYQSGDAATTLSNGDAATGSVTVTIEIPAGGAPLVAGSYSDQLILELAAAG